MSRVIKSKSLHKKLLQHHQEILIEALLRRDGIDHVRRAIGQMLRVWQIGQARAI